MHLKNININSEKSNFMGKIIRGNYMKEYADGNKKLYINNELQGKFS